MKQWNKNKNRDWTPEQIEKLDQDVQKGLLAMATTTTTARISEIIEHKDKDFCPLPIGIIPDQMGINLCCVRDISWTRQGDGQLTRIVINLIPNYRGVPQAEEEETDGKTIKASRR